MTERANELAPTMRPVVVLALLLPFALCIVLGARGAMRIVRGWSEPAALRVDLPTPNLPTPGDDGAPADWCTPPYEPVPGGGCLAEAAVPSAEPLLILYLHGRYALKAPGDEADRQRRLAAKAAARGWSVVAMRGTLGACSAPELSDWFCWPTGAGQAASAASAADAWTNVARAVDQRRGPAARVILGFSNGGYFAVWLVTQGRLDVRAAVIAHAGPVDSVIARNAEPPLLLLSADDDVAQDDMIRLDEQLGRAGWPHDSYARAGVHGLTDDDIDAALAFYARMLASEAVPLDPPLRGHRPTHHAREAAAMPAHDNANDDASSATPNDESDAREDVEPDDADDSVRASARRFGSHELADHDDAADE